MTTTNPEHDFARDQRGACGSGGLIELLNSIARESVIADRPRIQAAFQMLMTRG